MTNNQRIAGEKIAQAAKLLEEANELIENDPDAPTAEASDDLPDVIDLVNALAMEAVSGDLIQDMGEIEE